jgi:hypothetical protein
VRERELERVRVEIAKGVRPNRKVLKTEYQVAARHWPPLTTSSVATVSSANSVRNSLTSSTERLRNSERRRHRSTRDFCKRLVPVRGKFTAEVAARIHAR